MYPILEIPTSKFFSSLAPFYSGVLALLLHLFAIPSVAGGWELRSVKECPTNQGRLQVSFLNVGQGDATLITCPDGQTQTLLDAGDSSQRYPAAEDLLRTALLKRLGSDTHIETAVATHPHQDHIYGFLSLLESKTLTFGRYLHSGMNDPANDLEEKLLHTLVSSRTAIHDLGREPRTSLRICNSPPVDLEFLALDPSLQRNLQCPDALNNCSLVSRLSYLGVTVLFLADTLLEWEQVALQDNAGRDFLLPSSVVKLGHHGSHSTSTALLSKIAPAATILSTGKPGIGTTEIHAFPEFDVVMRLKAWYSRASGTVLGETRVINACEHVKGTCRWLPIELPLNVWSTAQDGTIDTVLETKKICLHGDSSKTSIEIDF